MYKLLLCLRYLRTRYIALASIVSVTLGVATMIVVNSVMAGFSTEMRQRIHGLLADVIIETSTLDGVPDADEHLRLVEQAAGPYIEAMTATVEVYGMLSFQYHGQWITRPVTLIGIKPQEKAKVGPLKDFLESYKPIKKDGQIVKPAERGRSVPLGWKLTDAAQEYRRWVTERRRTLQSFRHEAYPETSPRLPEPPSTDDQPSPPPFDLPAEEDAPMASPFDDEPNQPATQPVAEDSAGDSAGLNDAVPTPNQPAGPEAVPLLSEIGNAPDDPAAPRDGRVYVGLGLISFPIENEKGEVETEMMVRPGDDVRISTYTAASPPNVTGFYATVVDVFKSGMSEYDANIVFCNLEHLQKVRGMIDPTSGVGSITSIQIKLKNYEDAPEVVERLEAAFPPGIYSVRTWEQKQGPLLAAVDVESAILNVLLFLIIAVAGFGILAIFFMIVVEKTRDIGILKALGASSGGVMSIFLSYGLALGIVGSGVGVVLGLLFVRHINRIEKWITWITGQKVFDERIYYFPEIPTSVSPLMVFWVALGAMTIAVLASILPARRAARLHPVEALRFE